jgi:hypothetical protein
MMRRTSYRDHPAQREAAVIQISPALIGRIAGHLPHPGPEKAVRGGQLGAFYGALEDADLMAQGEDLQLKGGTSPKRGAEEGEKGG